MSNGDSNGGKKKLRVLQAAAAATTTTTTSGDGNDPKTVLPEVLPDPRRSRAVTVTPPRARTLAHMQRLLAAAAAVSVASGGVACGKETKTAGSERQGCGGRAKPPTDNTSSSGYAVVDPMPAPVYCPGIANLITSSGKLVDRDGATDLVVTFSKPTGRDDFKYVSDAPAVGYGGTVTKTDAKPDGTMTVTMKLAPGMADAATPSVSLSVKGTCNQGPTTISASVTWTGPTKTAQPAIQLNEY